MTETDAALVTRVLTMQGLTVRDGHLYTAEGVLVESLRARMHQYLESESGWAPLLLWATRAGMAPIVSCHRPDHYVVWLRLPDARWVLSESPHPGRALCAALICEGSTT